MITSNRQKNVLKQYRQLVLPFTDSFTMLLSPNTPSSIRIYDDRADPRAFGKHTVTGGSGPSGTAQGPPRLTPKIEFFDHMVELIFASCFAKHEAEMFNFSNF